MTAEISVDVTRAAAASLPSAFLIMLCIVGDVTARENEGLLCVC